MELEEMKAVWSDLSEQLEQQKKLTDEIILKMTQQQYRTKINKIFIPELIGTIICFGMGAILLFNLSKLDTTLTLSTGILTILILFALPVLSLGALRRLRSINVVSNTYQQTMQQYTRGIQQWQSIQQISLYISFVLMFVMVPPMLKIIKGKDLTIGPEDLLIYVPLAFIFFAFFTSYVYRCYRSVVRSTDQMLQDLE
jgi:hypothetical protein